MSNATTVSTMPKKPKNAKKPTLADDLRGFLCERKRPIPKGDRELFDKVSNLVAVNRTIESA